MMPVHDEPSAVEAICALVGQTLDIEDVSADEDFFELGGTSLKGAELIAMIERRLGRQLKPADLYEAPTPAALAARLGLNADDVRDTFSVATLPSAHAATAHPPVFLVHRIPPDLARALGRRLPVIGLSYGLAAAGGNTGWPPPVGVEDLAAHYVEQMRRTRPEGPYHLVGQSNGGIIAWEMARQLREAGAEVGVVCVIDTGPLTGGRLLRVGWRKALRNIASTSPRLLGLIAQRLALWRLIHMTERLSRLLPEPSETPRERWERSNQPTRLDLIDLQREAYRMRPMPSQPLLIEAVAVTSILSEPIPLAHTYDDAGLTPNGHILVQLPASHLSVVRSPSAERVAAAVAETISSTTPS